MRNFSPTFAACSVMLCGFVLVVVMTALGIGLWIFGIYNTEVSLSVRYEAQNKVVETSLDTMRNTLQNEYRINREFAETFLQCAQTNVEGRKGGSLFKSVQEASGNVPQTFTPELAVAMMNTISGELAAFKRSQDTLVDVWREHETFCKKMPNSFFVGGRSLPEPVVISSTTSKETMETKILEDNLLE